MSYPPGTSAAARSSEHRKAFGQLLKWALDLLAGAAGKLPPKTFVVALQRKNKHFGDQQLAAAARDWGHAARCVLAEMRSCGRWPGF
jgi:hypothetical protein